MYEINVKKWIFVLKFRQLISKLIKIIERYLWNRPKGKRFYKNSKNNWNLLDLKYFNLWKFNFNNETLYFESEENVYKYVEKYVEANIKEKQ